MKFLLQYFCLFFLLSQGVFVQGQTTTSSPYSVYGIGELQSGGYGSSRAMGGSGFALSSSSELNVLNPASYNSIDSLAFLFETGMEFRQSKYKLGTTSNTSNHTNFSFLSIGFRYSSRWANSFGVAPFSSVGNKLTVSKNIEGTSDYATTTIEGTGGLTEVYWANSFRIYKGLSVGVNLVSVFGNILQTQNTESDYYSGSLSTEDNIYVSKLCPNFGLQYSTKLSENNKISIGGVFAPKYTLSLSHSLVNYDHNGNALDDDASNFYNSTFYLPMNYGFGASFSTPNLIATADFSMQKWSVNSSKAAGIKYGDASGLSVGLEYLPAKSFRDPYVKKLKYRVGAYNRNSYLIIKNNQLYDRGLTAGIGIPVFKQRFFINLSYEAGIKRASATKGIIVEKYQGAYFNVIMSDFWFVKPKYD